MRRLVFVTQRIDPADPNLAATVPMVAALARSVDEVTVLALAAEPAALPPNVRVRTFGAPTRLGRGLRFASALAAELWRRPDALVAHMSPIYALLAAPLARPLGTKVVLWFTHWRGSRLLRLAERASSAVVSVDARSFPIRSAKVRAIGHGIDLREFPCTERPSGPPVRLLALGRYSPAKGLDVVVRGVAAAAGRGLDVTLLAHGPCVTDEERRHRRELEALVAELGQGGRVTLGGPVPRAEVPALLAGATALVNNMRAGAPDKVVYEAAAACVPVLASNPVFDGLVAGLEPPLLFTRERPDELAARIEALPGADLAAIGRALRERVEARHSVETWAAGVLEAAGL
ncbi:MAG TPA: glycosyltransferase family 4 protein [Gaiellaceae bacterium]|nr:glycosyltransferase family 4 protein [Gaiellaceae bacterium]